MKKSDSYKTLEEKVGSAYENVKGKVSTPSRSGSMNSFDDGRSASGLQSPTIPEEKAMP